jgi:hypothetical protein
MAEMTRTIQDEVLDFLLSAPGPEQIIAFHASETSQARLRSLLDANRNASLTDSERAELDEATHLNHMMILLKARAFKVLDEA